MNPFIVGAGLVAMNRVMSGQLEFGEKTKATIVAATDSLDELSRTIGDLSANQPSSWVSFARRLLKQSIGESSQNWAQAWLGKQGYMRKEDRLPSLWTELWKTAHREIVFRDDSSVVWRLDLGGKFVMAPLSPGESFTQTGRFAYHPDVHLPDDDDLFRATLKAIGDFFWRGRSAVLMDRVGDTDRFVDIQLADAAYIGPLVDQIEVWQRYRDAGLRRCVLLQGRPGTGKSTFAREAARRLSKRTLILSPESAGDIGATDWQFVLDALAPDMVIFDDVDRMGSHTLESRLGMFEEGYCDVPFILFTSNDHLELPQAMRRPGRIDQIIEVDAPDDDACRHIVHELAARVGVDVPDDRLSELMKLASGLSNAHLVERLRRARVEGWDHMPLPNDITFSDGFAPENDDDDWPSNVPSRRKGQRRRLPF